ncbi:exodeoxyribonuclease VII large subunit [Sphingoaurantiacus capsulatus]|uniref:Exodeoxyribonuclease 7 large subunit n=1 Tax=Sphingoaurantiacus capsulatus TaxID=1771310 RepID=A0ABV7X7X6_9SPHN
MTQPPANTPEFSVSEIAHALKRTVEDAFGHVRVRGEISGLKVAASGHVYLCLKDENALLDGVMWKGPANALRFRPEDGLEVIATGKLTTYPGRSKYQLIIERMEPAGAGALMALLEQRKTKLAAEGLFAAERKRPLPFLPGVIGVVTSPTGAVIRDILHRLSDRFPRHVLVWPVLVQGEGAAEQVARAVRGFNALPPGGPIPRPDLLIVARGGGSIEDLWAFNEEVVVRAVADSDIPTISAVGHETDTTLCDFAADRRAPTPTAAAEMAVPVRDDLIYTVGTLGLRLDRALSKDVAALGERVQAVAARLPTPHALFALRQQRFDDLADRLPRALGANAQRQRVRYERAAAPLRPALFTQGLKNATRDLTQLGQKLDAAMADLLRRKRHAFDPVARVAETLNPRATLQRGYAVVTRGDGHYITGADEARAAGALTIEFADGKVDVTTGEAPAAPRSAPKPAPRPRDAGPAGRQGELL